jgi:alcohol dehydrogenase (NADP+)
MLLHSGWGPLSTDWVCPGHEIVGKVIHVGEEAASEFPVGTVAGVGAQVQSCMKCDRCLNDNENYCPQQVDTYNSATIEDGKATQGGYSTMIRTDKRKLFSKKTRFLSILIYRVTEFVFKIPSGLPPQDAAPALCAGATVFSPLKRNGCGPGKLVGIVGMGGLGRESRARVHVAGSKLTTITF